MRFKTFLAELSGRIVDGNDVNADDTFTNLTNKLAGRTNDKPDTREEVSGDDAASKVIQLIATKRRIEMSNPDLRAIIDPLDEKARIALSRRLTHTHAYLTAEHRTLSNTLDTAKKPDGTPLFRERGGTKPSKWLPNFKDEKFIDGIYASWASFSGTQLAARIKDLETNYADKALELIKSKPDTNKRIIAGAVLHYLVEIRMKINEVLQELGKAPKTTSPAAPGVPNPAAT